MWKRIVAYGTAAIMGIVCAVRIFRRVYDHDGDGKRDGAFL